MATKLGRGLEQNWGAYAPPWPGPKTATGYQHKVGNHSTHFSVMAINDIKLLLSVYDIALAKVIELLQ